MGEVLTAAEVAQLLRIDRKTVYKLVKAGDLPGRKVGGQWRFRAKAVTLWAHGSPYLITAGTGIGGA